MIDFAKITVKGGKGGNGAGSFRRVKGKRRGKADGGDGGTGGNVRIEATLDLNTLEPFRFVKNYKAKDGQGGFSNLRRGANGQDLVLKVPAGTVIQLSVLGFQLSDRGQSVDQSTGQPRTGKQNSDNRQQKTDNWATEVFDLVFDGQKVLVAKGGEGGRGNAKLRDEFGRRPKRGEAGAVGDVCDITLELKLIADVGLIGFPNAGKSTLLAVLTAARPQIASYPFTTLEPNLGVLKVESQSRKSKSEQEEKRLYTSHFDFDSLVLADIPGLIEGAAEGRGLGDLFLKHIERTKMLVHLIDVSASGDHWQDYQTIRSELKTYSKDLTKKKEIVVLNKIDLVNPSEVSKIRRLFSQKRKRVLTISALNKEGLEELVREIVARV